MKNDQALQELLSSVAVLPLFGLRGAQKLPTKRKVGPIRITDNNPNCMCIDSFKAKFVGQTKHNIKPMANVVSIILASGINVIAEDTSTAH